MLRVNSSLIYTNNPCRNFWFIGVFKFIRHLNPFHNHWENRYIDNSMYNSLLLLNLQYFEKVNVSMVDDIKSLEHSITVEKSEICQDSR